MLNCYGGVPLSRRPSGCGVGADGLLAAAARLLSFGRQWCAEQGVTEPEFNLGGGMAVDYTRPDAVFDRPGYGRGWYLTRVLDVKHSHGEAFAVVAGGTHHLRTPVAKGHDQPFAVVAVDDWALPWPWPPPRSTRTSAARSWLTAPGAGQPQAEQEAEYARLAEGGALSLGLPACGFS